MKAIRMADVELADRRVLIREDFNVPISDGAVTSDARIRAALPTLKSALDRRARVLVMSHLGRPKEGERDPTLSLAPVAKALSTLLARPVRFVEDWIGGVEAAPGEVVLLENVRFLKGEKKDDEALAKRMAALCDVFVMDAFGTAHRAQASTNGVARHAAIACAGPLLIAELEALAAALENPKRPLLAIVGGSKVSTKLTILAALAEKVDELIVGGGIANTFLLAAGGRIGRSLAEPELVDEARKISGILKAKGGAVCVPTDVVCAKAFSASAPAETKPSSEVADDDLILDIGPRTAEMLAASLEHAGTIVWNGPVGVFEFDQFSNGTKTIAHAIAKSTAFSIAGGGDTLAAIAKYGVADRISYISTGGGAFLEFLEGKTLPAIEILEKRAAEK